MFTAPYMSPKPWPSCAEGGGGAVRAGRQTALVGLGAVA